MVSLQVCPLIPNWFFNYLSVGRKEIFFLNKVSSFLFFTKRLLRCTWKILFYKNSVYVHRPRKPKNRIFFNYYQVFTDCKRCSLGITWQNSVFRARFQKKCSVEFDLRPSVRPGPGSVTNFQLFLYLDLWNFAHICWYLVTNGIKILIRGLGVQVPGLE